MFTGLITDIGELAAREETLHDIHLFIRTAYDTTSIALGSSIACNGICLTVTKTEDDWFTVTASTETARVSTLDSWRPGMRINLERALKLGDELGGHLVSGHVDGLATLTSITAEGESTALKLEAPPELARFIARKGSVTLDGISLTVNEVEEQCFSVMIIPHTWHCTTLAERQPGDRLNLEVDLLARYVQRLQQQMTSGA